MMVDYSRKLKNRFQSATYFHNCLQRSMSCVPWVKSLKMRLKLLQHPLIKLLCQLLQHLSLLRSCWHIPRLGRKNNLIIYNSVFNANQKSLILHNASRLRKSTRLQITDLSPKEREAAKELIRAELTRRRSQGEKNIAIRQGKILSINQNLTTEASLNSGAGHQHINAMVINTE